MKFFPFFCLVAQPCQSWIQAIDHRGSRNEKKSFFKNTQLFARKIYFRGRSVPYAETFEEQKSREMWEHRPFDHASRLMDTVLSNEDAFPSQLSPILTKLQLDPSENPSGFEDLFLPLYGTKSDDIWQESKTTLLQEQGNDRLRHFFIRVAYKGSDFCGWQRQPHNSQQPSVQAIVEDWLQELSESKKSVRVCGRTDAGVSALGQVCRFRTSLPINTTDVYDHLQRIPSTSMKILQVMQVTRAFHPSFTCDCRAYVYLIDSRAWDGFDEGKVNVLNQILLELERTELDYIGMSFGKLKTKTSLCTLYHARASLVSLSSSNDVGEDSSAICIELVGNRFLRRMVRMLVEAAVRIALTSSEESRAEKDALLKQIKMMDRRLIGPAAPPDGLFFVGARFNAM